VDHEHIAAVIRAVAQDDAATILEIVGELAAQARDLETVLSELAEALHRISLVQIAPGYQDPERSDWDSIAQLAEMLSPEDSQLYYQIAVQGGRDLGIAPDPRTGLEMTLLRMLAFRPAEPASSGNTNLAQGSVKTAGNESVSGTGTSRVASATDRQNSPSPEPAKPETTTQSTRESLAEPTHTGDLELVSAGREAQPINREDKKPELDSGAGKDSEDWHGLLGNLELAGPVKELARNIQLESKSGDRWEFLIPDTVRHLGSKAMVQKLETALSSQLGHPVNLALHTASKPVATPAVVGENASRQRMNEAERAIDQDSTVRDLKDQFGATIIEDSVQPLQ
jgi:DNA polymerase-3 subunit gamma/tau